MNIDAIVVSSWDYYFNESIKSVANRPSKRQRIEGTQENIVVWDVANKDPQQIVVATTSILGEMTNSNAMIVCHRDLLVDHYKEQVNPLKQQLLEAQNQHREEVDQLINKHKEIMSSL